MDEQRVWLRSRRKKRLRLLAAALCLSLLFTTYPDMLGFLSVFAAESQGEGSTLYVSRFVSLPKEVREQTVFTGTEAEELSLPDGLEAVAVMPEGGKPSEDAGEEKKSPEDAGAGAEEEKPEDKGAKAEEEKPADDETKPEEPSAKDDAVPEPGEKQTDAAEGTGTKDTGTKDTGTKDTGTKDTGTKDTGESDNIEENTDEENKEGQDTQPEEATGETAGETAGEETVAAQEAHIVTMPEYHGGNVITVRSLENTQGAGTKEETVFIEGVTWKSEPAYDGNTEGTYVFTAVLPEGYALMEGAGLPQITVTVQDSGEAAMIQALLDRVAALPDAKEYLAGEPDTEEEEAYGEWMEGLYEYAEEALGIQEEYEALTEEQRAQIPKKALDRLSAWVKIAEEIAGNSMVMAATVKEWDCGADGNNVTAVLDDDGTLTISGSGAMADYQGSSPSRAPWYDNYRTKIKRVVIDSGVTSIGSYAFNGCNTLTEVTIPDSVTSIGKWAFKDCRALTEVVIPNGVTSVEEGTFYYCNSLRKVTIPDGVTSIGDGAFSNCWKLTEVAIPNGVTSIKSDAFRGCSLTEVTIPNSVTSIGFNAFYDCTSLATVTFEGTATIPTLGSDCFLDCSFVTNNEKGIKVPCQYLDAYKGQTGWSSYEAYIIERHNLSHVPAKAATCAVAGNTEHWKCLDCGSLFSDSTGTTATTADAVAIAKLAHSYSYTASGAVITETCDKGCGHSATATLSIKSGADLIYTGSEIKPVTVTYSSGWAGTGSNRPADTAITYTNNINAGTATAKLTVSGKTASLTFTIASKPLTDSMITVASGPHHYTGSAVTPAVTVKDGSTTLTSGTDYTVSYTDNVNVGNAAKVTVTGTGNYMGSIEKTFTIASKPLTDSMITVASGPHHYTGSAVTPAVTVKDGSTTLTSGTDYTVSYTDNVNVGNAAKVTVTGTGNYMGSIEKTFTIASKPLTDNMITVASGPHYYTGTAVTPAVTVKDGSTTLTSGTDYTVSYTDNVNVGNAAKVTVTGTGNYTGSIEKTFTVECSPLPSGKSLTDYITVSPSPDENGWYHSDITLTPKSGCEAGETPAGMGSGAVTISEETGPDGSTKTIYIKDSDGSFYQTEFSYKLDKTPPAFSGEPEVRDRTQEGGDIAFTSTEDGKAYWLVSGTGTKPGAQEVVNGGAKKGSVKDVTGGLPDSFTVTGLSPKETYTVYVVLVDAAGNLSEVKEVSLTAEDSSVTEEPSLPGDNDDTDNPADTTQPGTSSPTDTTQPGTSSPTDTTQPGTSSPTDTTQPGTSSPTDTTQPAASSPAPAAKPAASSGQKPKSPSGKDRNSGKRTGTQSAGQQTEEQEKENTDTQGTDTQDTDTQKTGIAEAGGTGTGAQQEREGAKTVPASIDGGRIVISGGAVGTGSLKEDWESATLLAAGDGAVIVTVVCEEGRYAAGVKDTAAVANAVLTKEQIQLVNDGGTIEIRIDVKDISETAAGQDKEVMESGLEAYREELPGLTPGRYVDISLFIRTGEGSWDAVASTGEPIEVVMGVPEELKADGREFYIIRSHEGEYTLLNDLDSDPDTITISTDLFSAYAVAYRQVDGAEGGRGCGLCHICPTFLGICCFVWLAVVLLAGGVLWFVLYKKKRGRMEG